MNQNPCTPPEGLNAIEAPRDAVFYACLFWISAILAIVTAVIAIGVGYQNYVAISRMDGTLPPYIIAVTLLVLACSFTLSYSALKWCHRQLRRDILSLAFAVAAVFGGPWLMLAIFAR